MIADRAALRLLSGVVAAHFLIDTLATIINPLWPTLQLQTASSDRQFFWLFLFWNVATSVAQILFGVLGDRYAGRWLIWAGPAAAVIALSCLGQTSSLWWLCLLVSMAGLGIAAFHPEAATLAGNCWPEHRSRAMSWFQLGGFLGQTLGPYYSGLIVDRWGVGGLVPGLLWMFLAVGLMRWGLRLPAAEHRSSTHAPVPLRAIFQDRFFSLLLLLAVGVLRLVAAAGVPMALAFMESARGSSTADIGLVQAAFSFGIGGGGLVCALLICPHHERILLWLLPLIAAPIVWYIPTVRDVWLMSCSAIVGLLLGITVPILIGLGQRLLPRSQRVGSSITMGMSWGLGGGIAALIVMGFKANGRIEAAFPLFACSAIASSLLCWLLPKEPGG